MDYPARRPPYPRVASPEGQSSGHCSPVCGAGRTRGGLRGREDARHLVGVATAVVVVRAGGAQDAAAVDDEGAAQRRCLLLEQHGPLARSRLRLRQVDDPADRLDLDFVADAEVLHGVTQTGGTVLRGVLDLRVRVL